MAYLVPFSAINSLVCRLSRQDVLNGTLIQYGRRHRGLNSKYANEPRQSTAGQMLPDTQPARNWALFKSFIEILFTNICIWDGHTCLEELRILC